MATTTEASTSTNELAATLLRHPDKAVLIEVGTDDASILNSSTFSLFEGDEGVLTIFVEAKAIGGDAPARQEFLRLAMAELLAECAAVPQDRWKRAAADHLLAAAEALGIHI